MTKQYNDSIRKLAQSMCKYSHTFPAAIRKLMGPMDYLSISMPRMQSKLSREFTEVQLVTKMLKQQRTQHEDLCLLQGLKSTKAPSHCLVTDWPTATSRFVGAHKKTTFFKKTFHKKTINFKKMTPFEAQREVANASYRTENLETFSSSGSVWDLTISDFRMISGKQLHPTSTITQP